MNRNKTLNIQNFHEYSPVIFGKHWKFDEMFYRNLKKPVLSPPTTTVLGILSHCQAITCLSYIEAKANSACVINFGSACCFFGGPRLPLEMVSARQTFWARGPILSPFTRQKLRVPCRNL